MRRAGEDAQTQLCSWHQLLLCPLLPLLPLPMAKLLLTHPSSCMQTCLLCVHQLWGHMAQAPHIPCAPGLGLAGTQQPQQQPKAP